MGEAWGLSHANNVLQSATAKGEWICWKPRFDGVEYVGEECHLANGHASEFVGMLGDGLDALLAALPDAERRLRAR